MKFTKEHINSKLSELRALKIYTKECAFPKKISDQVLVDDLFVLLNSKGFADEFDMIEDNDGFSDIEVNSILKDKYAKEILEKYKKEKFDLNKIYSKICKEATKITNINRELNDNVVISSYWLQDQKVFPEVKFNKLVDNYNLRNTLISEVMEYISKHRNLPNAKLAKSFEKKQLIGKFVVTEENILHGFMKCMTLKYNGFLPGEIVETRYGVRHGLDNFWDDHVSARDFLVLKLNNITGSKSIAKLKGGLWAIDLTKTLQVFDTMNEAVEVSNQLNEFHKKSLSLY